MKQKLILLLGAFVAIGLFFSQAANAITLNVDVGDQPYYDGPTYWDGGYRWVWVAGHREHGHWVHGHYNKQGEFHKEHANEHHHHHDEH